MEDEQKPKSKKANTAADIVLDENGKEVREDAPEVTKSGNESSRWHRFVAWYKDNKKKSVPLTILALLVLLFGIPWPRYHITGLVMKKNLSVQVVDSTAGTPVSGADVSLGSAHSLTDGSGKATLSQVKVGPHKLLVSKKYYKDYTTNVVVPILSQKTVPNIKFVATGRQVKVSVKNLISHQALANVDIKVSDINAKTDSTGSAIIVLPVGTQSEKTSLSLDGYNDSAVIVKANDKTIQENDFNLTPAGKVYFLSKLSGKIDVVKTNLDGSGRQTVLAGTGKEDDRNTVLLASRDWKYLALKSKRDNSASKIYLIDTSTDKLTTMDEGDADFAPIGWQDHYFMYKVSRNNHPAWQPNATSIKSYNAQSKQSLTLVNTNASGSSNADAQYEVIFDTNTYIVGGNLVYAKTWYQYPGFLSVSGKQNVLGVIHPDGTGGKTAKSVDAGTSYFSSFKLNTPDELYFGLFDNSSSNTSYYAVDENGSVSSKPNLADKDVSGVSTTYLASPSNKVSFWSDERDGKLDLLLGDYDGTNGKTVARVSTDYQTYGWYTDDYLLVSKKSSELYIMPKSGVQDETQLIKITDYHKPAQNFYGYGGGYGGI
jgi:DNA-binding protein